MYVVHGQLHNRARANPDICGRGGKREAERSNRNGEGGRRLTFGLFAGGRDDHTSLSR